MNFNFVEPTEQNILQHWGEVTFRDEKRAIVGIGEQNYLVTFDAKVVAENTYLSVIQPEDTRFGFDVMADVKATKVQICAHVNSADMLFDIDGSTSANAVLWNELTRIIEAELVKAKQNDLRRAA